MTLEATLLDFNKFKKLELLKKFEYFHCNKVFDEVYKVQAIESGKYYLANISRPESEKKNSKSLQRLLKILPTFDHPSILRFVGYCKIESNGNNRSAIITEYFPTGTLTDVLNAERDNHPLPGWNDTKKLIAIYGIASGMMYMHSKNVLHRNLNPMSIIFDDSFFPKIRNFNLIINANDESAKKPIKSSTEYTAPEIFMREPSTKAMDVYSFGMLVYEMVTLNHPFGEIENLNIIHVLQKVEKNQMPVIENSVPLAFKNLIESCWNKNPNERPTFDNITRMLKSDPGFITEKVNKDEFVNYTKFVDKFQTRSNRKSMNNIAFNNKRQLKEQIKMKTEENKQLRKENEHLKKNLIDVKQKLNIVMKQKENESID